MEACAYAALGATYRLVQKYDKALGYHTQELEVYQELGNASGECKAHGHLAAVYMALGKYAMAFKSYEEQLELGQKLKDPVVEAQVYGNMGITKMNVGVMEEAIGYLEQQLATLQQLSGNEALMDRGRAYGNLGDCYEALGDFEEAIKYYDQYLSVAQSLNRMQDQEKAYRGLGNGHRFVTPCSTLEFQKTLLSFYEVFQIRRDCVEWVIPIIALILFCILFLSRGCCGTPCWRARLRYDAAARCLSSSPMAQTYLHAKQLCHAEIRELRGARTFQGGLFGVSRLF